LKYVLRYVLVLVYTVFWGAIATVLGLVDRSGNAVIWIGRNWIAWILAGCGIRVIPEGVEDLDPAQPAVFMSNHQSVIDIAALVHTIPFTFRFVAKRELTRIPLFGWALALGGHIIIDRGDRPKAMRSLEKAAEQIGKGTHVIMYPEGTRSPTGELQAFKKGGFHLAIAAQVPIIPVTVSGTKRITPKRSLRIESGAVKIRYGKPIPTRGLTSDDRHALAAQVRQAIQNGFDPRYQENVA
jgi:1-acyl-sn-glycerol-3-phosphate acyltransferase